MPETTNKTVTFSPQLVAQTGGIGNVLRQLMDDQVRAVQDKLNTQFKAGQVPKDAVKKILDAFVSLEGTKLPRSRTELAFPGFTDQLVLSCLQELTNARLLREYEQGMYELAHDTLAAEIASRRDQSLVAMREAVKLVQNGFENHLQTGKSYLGSDELQIVAGMEDRIRSHNGLNEEEWTYVNASKREAGKRRRRRKIYFWSLAAFAALLFILLAVLGVYSRRITLAYDQIAFQQDSISEANRLIAETFRLNQQTANAFSQSKTDRRLAFFNVSEAAESLDKPGFLERMKSFFSAKGDEQPQTNVAKLLKQDLVYEFSILPFYNQDQPLSGNVAQPKKVVKVLAEDSLRYFLGLGESESVVNLWPVLAAGNTAFRELGKNFQLIPDSLRSGGNVTDMITVDGGRRVVTSSDLGQVWIWDVYQNRQKKIHDFGQPVDMLTEFNGDALAVIDSMVYLVHLDGRRFPAEFKIGFNREVKLIAANPDPARRQFAVVKDYSSEIFLCKMTPGKGSRGQDTLLTMIEQVQRPPYVETAATALAFSPGGRRIIAAFEGDVAILWALNRPDILTEFRGHLGLISDITFSPDGRSVLTGSWDKTAILWNTDGEIIKRLVGHTDRILSVSFTDTGMALTAGRDGSVKIWNLSSLATYNQSMNDRIRAMATSLRGDRVAFSCFGDRGFFWLWDFTNGKLEKIAQPRGRADSAGEITALAFSSDGESVLAGSLNNLTTLIDLREGTRGRLLEDYRSAAGGAIPPTTHIVALDLNDRYVAIADRAGQFVLLRNRQNARDFKILRHLARVNDLRFSPDDNRYLLTGCDDGRAYLWDVDDERPRPQYLCSLGGDREGHSSRLVAVDFSDDGAYVLTGSYDNTAILWKRTGDDDVCYSFLEALEKHTADVMDVAFDRNWQGEGYRFLTASKDKTVKLWQKDQAHSAEEIPTIIRHLSGITGAGFVGNGRFIATGSNDRSVKVWRAISAEKIIEEEFGE